MDRQHAKTDGHFKQGDGNNKKKNFLKRYATKITVTEMNNAFDRLIN